MNNDSGVAKAFAGFITLGIGIIVVAMVIQSALCGSPSTPSARPSAVKSVSDQEASERRLRKIEKSAAAVERTPERIIQARAVLSRADATLLELASSRNDLTSSRSALPPDAPELKSIDELLSRLDARILRLSPPPTTSRPDPMPSRPEPMPSRDEDEVGGAYWADSPGIHRTPAGRLYSVKVDHDGDNTTYTYTGCIDGQVITNKFNRIVYDSRTFDE